MSIAEAPVIEPTQTDPELDHDRPKEAHIVDKAKCTEAYVMGTPLVALCGKVFTPSRDPNDLPVCPRCVEVWTQVKAGQRGDN